MFEEIESPSPMGALIALAPLDPEWQPILHSSNQVVLYNATSHALSIHRHSGSDLARRNAGNRCPYCHRFLPTEFNLEQDSDSDDNAPRSRAPNYFQLLEIANESAASRPGTHPRTIPSGSTSRSRSRSRSSGSAGATAFHAENMAEGYFKAFFKEEYRLGMGANGAVFLCQHVLDGNSLGHFAVKKIAVGQSHAYLLNILREVRLLERLHHPNIVTYHHAWLETCQFSSFGPQVPTLYILMQWAEGGSLDDLIDARLGRRVPAHIPKSSDSPSGSPAPEHSPSQSMHSRNSRIRMFRTLQRAAPADRERLRRELGLANTGGASSPRAPADWKAVHLLSAEEVRGLFGDVISGLAFLHDKSILHLDLKPGNVLLAWDEGKLIPRAMLSDFGTSQDMLKSRMRSGNTGTLEYSSPESLPSPSGLLQQVDSKSDMWSVGMILHKLLFFRLPYRHASDGTADAPKDGKENMEMLEREVQSYPGFRSSGVLVTVFESRRLPRAYLVLLEGLLNVIPSVRPSSERVLSAILEGKLDPLSADPIDRPTPGGTLIPVPLRHASFEPMPPYVEAASLSDSPDLHARVSQERDLSHSAGSSPAPGNLDEKRAGNDVVSMSLFSLPILPRPIPAIQFHMNGALMVKVKVGRRQLQIRIPAAMWMRTLKACALLFKFWSLLRICPDGHHPMLSTTAILGFALLDTWFDSWMSFVVFGLVHFVLVLLVYWLGWCSV
ncbi:kinase-like protein [Wolfiporia cocos MD-104 SS10]|uniref:non-specific serine/threonine protein kinase n=1 Tax=Wolfiporia cocos (strain MD-104) TaxID=742152 RepID=A0A2H3K9J5_WOLCO|nr:kinase-like protein [Wolfiporia cocos MD-104 SS10]